MIAKLQQSFSLYTLVSVIVGAQGAVLVFIHHFGNSGADTVAGAILMGLAGLSVVGHSYLQMILISIPAGVYNVLQTVDGIAVTLLGASGIIVQYVGTATPTLTPLVAVVLQGLSLVASLFAQLFKVSVVTKAAARAALAAKAA